MKTKKMSLGEFSKRFLGIRALRFLPDKGVRMLEVRYTPARKFLEFKLSHEFLVYQLYDRKEDATYMFILDRGWIAISGADKKDEGICCKVSGKVEDVTKDQDILKIMDVLYKEWEQKYEDDRENRTA